MNDLKELTEKLRKMHFRELAESFNTYIELKTTQTLNVDDELNFLLEYNKRLKYTLIGLDVIDDAIENLLYEYKEL